MRLGSGDLTRGLRLSSDGKHASSADFGDGTISVIDLITKSIAAALDVLSQLEAAAVSADGEHVYVGDYWSRAVTAISVPKLHEMPATT